MKVYLDSKGLKALGITESWEQDEYNAESCRTYVVLHLAKRFVDVLCDVEEALHAAIPQTWGREHEQVDRALTRVQELLKRVGSAEAMDVNPPSLEDQDVQITKLIE